MGIKKHKMDKNQVEVISVPVFNGELLITIDSSESYPFVATELIRENDNEDYISNTQIVVDNPNPEVDSSGFKVSIWGDRNKEDPTETIHIKTN